MLERNRFSSQVKLPQLETSQNHRIKCMLLTFGAQVPLSSGNAEFVSFRTIGEQNPHFAFNKSPTESSLLNQSIVAELSQKKKVKEILDQTLTKFKSDHQEQQLHLKKKLRNVMLMQRNIKCYPQKFETVTNSLKTPPQVQRLKKQTYQAPFNGAYWHKSDSSWLPQVRECSMATVFGKQVYIFGGIGSEVIGDMLEYDIPKNRFAELDQVGDVPLPRYGHCLHALTYQMGLTIQFSIDNFSCTPLTGRYLILFGGEMQFNQQLKLRENLNDTRLFNIENGQWTLLKPNLEAIPDSRRSFGSCIAGRGLVIHGGIKSRFNALNDMHYLNLSLCRWQPLETQNNPYPKGLAFQQLICAYQKPYMLLEKRDQRTKAPKFLDHEAIYSFGGCYLNPDKSTSYYPFFVATLKLEGPQNYWQIPEYSGKSPSERICHSATHIPEANTIVVFGGRDDKLMNPYFCDLYALRVIEKEWVTLEVSGEIPRPRASHIAFGFKSKLMIMGGVNLEGYQYQGIQIAEFNQSDIRMLAELQEQKQQVLVQQLSVQRVAAEHQIQSVLPSTQRLSILKQQKPSIITHAQPKLSRREEILRQLSFENFRHYKR